MEILTNSGNNSGNPETRERESSYPYDAIHLVVYDVKEGKEVLSPSPRGAMQINAVVDLIEGGFARNVVMGGVTPVGGENLQFPVSTVYAQTLRERLEAKKISGVNIIAESDAKKGARETGGEVDFMLGVARQNNWSKIMCVYYNPHYERLLKLYESRGFHSSFESSESIISQKHPHFRERFERSPFRVKEGTSFEESEKKKLAFMAIDRKGRIITFLARHMPQGLNKKLKS